MSLGVSPQAPPGATSEDITFQIDEALRRQGKLNSPTSIDGEFGTSQDGRHQHPSSPQMTQRELGTIRETTHHLETREEAVNMTSLLLLKTNKDQIMQLKTEMEELRQQVSTLTREKTKLQLECSEHLQTTVTLRATSQELQRKVTENETMKLQLAEQLARASRFINEQKVRADKADAELAEARSEAAQQQELAETRAHDIINLQTRLEDTESTLAQQQKEGTDAVIKLRDAEERATSNGEKLALVLDELQMKEQNLKTLNEAVVSAREVLGVNVGTPESPQSIAQAAQAARQLLERQRRELEGLRDTQADLGQKVDDLRRQVREAEVRGEEKAATERLDGERRLAEFREAEQRLRQAMKNDLEEQVMRADATRHKCEEERDRLHAELTDTKSLCDSVTRALQGAQKRESAFKPTITTLTTALAKQKRRTEGLRQDRNDAIEYAQQCEDELVELQNKLAELPEEVRPEEKIVDNEGHLAETGVKELDKAVVRFKEVVARATHGRPSDTSGCEVEDGPSVLSVKVDTNNLSDESVVQKLLDEADADLSGDDEVYEIDGETGFAQDDEGGQFNGFINITGVQRGPNRQNNPDGSKGQAQQRLKRQGPSERKAERILTTLGVHWDKSPDGRRIKAEPVSARSRRRDFNGRLMSLDNHGREVTARHMSPTGAVTSPMSAIDTYQSKLKAKIAELEEAGRTAQRERRVIETKLEDTDIELRRTKEKLAEAEREVEHQRGIAESIREQLDTAYVPKTEYQDMVRLCDVEKRKCDELRAEQRRSNELVASQQAKNVALQEGIDKAEAEAEGLRKEVAALEGERASLRADLKKALRELTSRKTTIERLEGDIQALNRTIATHKEHIKALNSQIDTERATIKAMQNNMDDTAKSNNAKQATLVNALNSARRLEADRSSLTNRVKDLEDTLATKDEVIARLSLETSRMKALNTQLDRNLVLAQTVARDREVASRISRGETQQAQRERDAFALSRSSSEAPAVTTITTTRVSVDGNATEQPPAKFSTTRRFAANEIEDLLK